MNTNLEVAKSIGGVARNALSADYSLAGAKQLTELPGLDAACSSCVEQIVDGCLDLRLRLLKVA